MMQEKLSLEMRFSFSGKKKAETVLKALLPDFSGKHEKHAETRASVKNDFLEFSINALDFAALRASMSSCAKSVALAKNLIGGFD